MRRQRQRCGREHEMLLPGLDLYRYLLYPPALDRCGECGLRRPAHRKFRKFPKYPRAAAPLTTSGSPTSPIRR